MATSSPIVLASTWTAVPGGVYLAAFEEVADDLLDIAGLAGHDGGSPAA